MGITMKGLYDLGKITYIQAIIEITHRILFLYPYIFPQPDDIGYDKVVTFN
jgi:hypothetical protein